MREKEQRIVITFHTTAEAMAAESAFKQRGIPGRLIPVPRQISSGCGLAWSSKAEDSAIVTKAVKEESLNLEGMGEYRI